MTERTAHHQATIEEDLSGRRLDQALAVLFPDFSRSRLQQWIREGLVMVDGKPCKPKDKLPRAGIVHRLDKETSGVLVVARTPGAHRSLVEQLQAREFKREYRAIATGVMTAGGTVDEPIGRHPIHRTRMAVVADGKHAVTHYRVLERFRNHTYLKVQLETGRTHQIRVHMAHIRYPLVGDPLYAGRLRLPGGVTDDLKEGLRRFRHQALHAYRLGLRHPRSGEWLEWESPLPEDMEHLLQLLREDLSHA